MKTFNISFVVIAKDNAGMFAGMNDKHSGPTIGS